MVQGQGEIHRSGLVKEVNVMQAGTEHKQPEDDGAVNQFHGLCVG